MTLRLTEASHYPQKLLNYIIQLTIRNRDGYVNKKQKLVFKMYLYTYYRPDKPICV